MVQVIAGSFFGTHSGEICMQGLCRCFLRCSGFTGGDYGAGAGRGAGSGKLSASNPKKTAGRSATPSGKGLRVVSGDTKTYRLFRLPCRRTSIATQTPIRQASLRLRRSHKPSFECCPSLSYRLGAQPACSRPSHNCNPRRQRACLRRRSTQP